MRVLVIGLGSIGKKHIQAIKLIDSSTEIVALRSGLSGNSYGDGLINILDLSELDVSVDFIIISNPTFQHKKTIESVLPLKKPLFIEKPSLMSLEGSQNLIDLIKLSQLLTYVACNLRFLECIQFLKEKLNSQKAIIQEVNVYCGSYLPEWRSKKDFKTVYSAVKEYGGGVHLDLIHELDYVYWLFGKPTKAQGILRSASNLNISAFDYANYVLVYPSFVTSIILNYYRRNPKRSIEIVFHNETWTVDLLNNIIHNSLGKIIFKSSQTIPDTYAEQMRYFYNLIQKKGCTSINSFGDSLEVLKIALHATA